MKRATVLLVLLTFGLFAWACGPNELCCPKILVDGGGGGGGADGG